MTIKEICSSFNIGGEYQECKELTTGYVNSTYQVRYLRDGEKKDYIVQCINTYVFKEPEKLMENIVNVTEYVRQNIAKIDLPTRRFVLRAYLTKKENKPYVVDDEGRYWRVYRYIENSITYEASENLSIIENTGKAFGRFQNCLDGYDASTLHISIPNFHNTIVRFENFKKAIELADVNRLKTVNSEIEELLSFEDKACKLQGYLDSGEIPLRVTHNDTRSNNVTFDKKTGEALAVLDLDTVMPGAMAYDFGDALRSIASTSTDDDPVVENVKISLEKYRAFAKGFLGEVKDKLTNKELETLNLGVFTMAVELSVRFLTDYLEGDKYFKTRYPGHNLDRARNQLALAKDILKKYDQMQEILQKCVK